MFTDFAAITDPGLVRKRNEDGYLVAQLSRTSREIYQSVDAIKGRLGKDDLLLLLVADGMGGESSGDLASRMVVEHFAEFGETKAAALFAAIQDGQAMRKLLCGELERCHWQIRHKSAENGELRGMGSTATIAVVAWPKLFVAHAGDSRCYLYRDHRLRQLTRDHTLARYFVDQGVMQASLADESTFRHQLWNVLGGNGDQVTVDFQELDAQVKDALLLCTDGLTNRLDDLELANLLQVGEDASSVCGTLVSAANAAGGRDNVTCGVVRFTTAMHRLSTR